MTAAPIGESDPAILAVDAGNTRVKWGVHDGRAWRALGAAPTAEAARVSEALDRVPAVRRAIVSNVAGPGVLAELERLAKTSAIALTVIRSEREQLGVVNGYRDPHQLGSDRWASLIAAHRAHAGHMLVVNVGTALTVDALSADGRFLGGLILPGPGLMRRSLERGTARLRQTEADFREFPASTPEAITSGSVQACIGAIQRMGEVMTRHDATALRVVLSGGGAHEIAPHLPIAFAIHENLVLDGLVLIARNS